MTYVCVTCGTQFPPADSAPKHCPICEDERHYIGLQGQRWITLGRRGNFGGCSARPWLPQIAGAVWMINSTLVDPVMWASALYSSTPPPAITSPNNGGHTAASD